MLKPAKRKLTAQEIEIERLKAATKFEINKDEEIRPEEEIKGHDEFAHEELKAKPISSPEGYYYFGQEGTYYKTPQDAEKGKIDHTIAKDGTRTDYHYDENGNFTGTLETKEKDGLSTYTSRRADGTLATTLKEVRVRMVDGTTETHNVGVNYYPDGVHKKSEVDIYGNRTHYNQDGSVNHYETSNGATYVLDDKGQKSFYTEDKNGTRKFRDGHYETADHKNYIVDDKGQKAFYTDDKKTGDRTFYTDSTLSKVDYCETADHKKYILDDKGQKLFYTEEQGQKKYYSEDREGNKTFYTDQGKTVDYYQSKDGEKSALTPREAKEYEALEAAKEKRKLTTKEQLKYDAYERRTFEFIKTTFEVKFDLPTAECLSLTAAEAERTVQAVEAQDRAQRAIRDGKGGHGGSVPVPNEPAQPSQLAPQPRDNRQSGATVIDRNRDR